MSSIDYRGYVIVKHQHNGGYVIREKIDYPIICSQPSLEFARKWIDQRHLELDRLIDEVHLRLRQPITRAEAKSHD
jgi:hypothetical protein